MTPRITAGSHEGSCHATENAYAIRRESLKVTPGYWSAMPHSPMRPRMLNRSCVIVPSRRRGPADPSSSVIGSA
jgi:hypothetical protein